MKDLILIIAVSFSVFGFSQKKTGGIFGKKTLISIGSSFAPTYYNYMKKKSDGGDYKFGPRIMNFSINVGVERIVSRKSVIGIKYNYDPAVLLTHGILTETVGSKDLILAGDQKFNNHEITFEYKYYPKKNIAGIGFFIGGRIGGSFVSAPKEVSRYSQQNTGSNYYDLYANVPSKQSRGDEFSYIMTTPLTQDSIQFKSSALIFGFIMGWDIPVTKFLILNFGMNMSFTYGNRKYLNIDGGIIDAYGNFASNLFNFFRRDRDAMFSTVNENLEYRLREAQFRKNILSFQFGLKIAI